MMKTKALFFLMSIFILPGFTSQISSITGENENILAKLKSLKDCSVKEIKPGNGYERQFQIDIIQPVDHDHPDGSTLKQRIYLSHKDPASPMIFIPSGYTSYPAFLSELSEPLEANQIHVAHRFYFRAQPQKMDWQYLNIRQAAADHHRIVEIFKRIYKGPWISFGVSKDGMTALFHRRFYPADVDATVVLGAPIPFSPEDPRYDEFLVSIGSGETRNKLKKYQRNLLINREQILPLINNYIKNSKDHYSISADLILEFEACEYAYAFWQLTEGDISYIPDEDAAAGELYEHLEAQGGFPSYSDKWREFNKPMYYQAYTEIGWYRLVSDHLQDLLITSKNPSYSYFTPKDVQLNFKPEIMQDINKWLGENGNNIIFIYGSMDPISACAIELTDQTNALKIIQQDANHYLKIDDLEEKELLFDTLKDWMNIE